MQKLHMVGFTTDHRGLILSVRRNAKSGGYVVNVDASIIEAIDELKALLVAEGAASHSNGEPSSRPQSALSVREIQARLRRGRTIEQVAREARVDPSWISRFAVPVLAEQAEVIRAARSTYMTKQRDNVSVLPLGEAVYRNLAERGVTDPRDQLDKAWRARQLTEGMWLITFTYSSRGRENKAQWEYDEATRVVRARNRLGGSVGFRQGPRRSAPPARPPVVKAGARSRKATVTRKAAAKKTPGKKAAEKKTSGKKAAAKKSAAKRGAVKKSAAKKAGVKKGAAKKSAKKGAAKKPAPASRAARTLLPPAPILPGARAATKAAAVTPVTARQSPSRQATRRVAALRRAAAARLEAEAEKATRRDVAAVRKAAKRPVAIPPRLGPPPGSGALLVDDPGEPFEEPDLDLDWDAGEREPDPAPEVEAAALPNVADTTIPPEDEPDEPDDEIGADDLDAVESEPDPIADVAPEVEPGRATAPQGDLQIPRPLRREPLRARPPTEPAAGNGPVFRDDLAAPAGELRPVTRSAVGQSRDVPISLPLDPIEPPPRRRRVRPLRGR